MLVIFAINIEEDFNSNSINKNIGNHVIGRVKWKLSISFMQLRSALQI